MLAGSKEGLHSVTVSAVICVNSNFIKRQIKSCYRWLQRHLGRPLADPQLVYSWTNTHMWCTRTHRHPHTHTHYSSNHFLSWCKVWPETAISLNVPISPPAYSLIPDSLPINLSKRQTQKEWDRVSEEAQEIKRSGEGSGDENIKW